MKTKSKVINGHSSEVGMKIYDKSNSRVKSEFVNFMHNKEQNQNEAHAIDLERFRQFYDSLFPGKLEYKRFMYKQNIYKNQSLFFFQF